MELVPRNILYSREELPIYHVEASEITALNGAEHESVFLLETVVSSFFWGDVSCLKIVGFLPAAFHLVSVGNTASIFRAISGDFRPFHRNAPENALDPAVSDRTYLIWVIMKKLLNQLKNTSIKNEHFAMTLRLNLTYLFVSFPFLLQIHLTLSFHFPRFSFPFFFFVSLASIHAYN
jgi:hypothetical protein